MAGLPHKVAGWQSPVRKDHPKKHPSRKLERERWPCRRSARLQEICRKQGTVDGVHLKQEHLLPHCQISEKGKTEHPLSAQKRKRTHNIQEAQEYPSARELRKRARISAASAAGNERALHVAASTACEYNRDLLVYWTRNKQWPKRFFEEDDETREYLNREFEEESWYRRVWLPNISHLLARRRSDSSLRKNSDSGSAAPGSTTPSDEKPREGKSADYKTPRYEVVLATKGSFMKSSPLGVNPACKQLCKSLLESEQVYPRDSLFRDDLFESTCETIRNRNETRVVRDVSLLIVPSAEIFSLYGARKLDCLIESVNEGWNKSIPKTKTRPQPDYAVGFRREAFTQERLDELQPFVGELTELSFMATYYMYLPFLTCEMKCGAAALDIADRQNAHSMALAVRGVVQLFKLAKREKELDREILAFSISHDHRTVRIYGHYAVIDGPDPKDYRHPIRTFDFWTVTYGNRPRPVPRTQNL